jgi:hypothetical protein
MSNPVRQSLIHHITERCHQGIGGRILRPEVSPSNSNAPSVRSNAGLVSADRSITTPVRLHQPQGGFSDKTGAALNRLLFLSRKAMERHPSGRIWPYRSSGLVIGTMS